MIEDQHDLGSCVGNAIANAYELMVRQKYPDQFVELSRLFVYYNARELEGDIANDSGAYIRTGLSAVKKWGICTEALWPYYINRFTVKPTPECYADAAKRKITEYYQLATAEDMIETLNNNQPVIIGMSVYESFDRTSKNDPVVAIPDSSDTYLGGHAVTVIGYDLDRQLFLFKNSYGTGWGDGGYGYITFEYERSHVFERWAFEISDQS